MPQTPARFTSGVSTARTPSDVFGNLPYPNYITVADYYNEFYTYLASDWTVAPATGTSALTASASGVLTLTTGAVSGNGQGNALSTACVAFTPGYQTWFSININVNTIATSNWIVGLVAGTASVPTSGVYFTKANATGNINAVLNKGGTTTTLATVTTATAATAISLGIYYDGKPTSTLYFYSSTGLTGASVATPSPTAFGSPPIYGGVRVASASNDGLNPNPLTNLPIVNLFPSFFVQTNTTAAATMAVDYVVSANELSRF